MLPPLLRLPPARPSAAQVYKTDAYDDFLLEEACSPGVDKAMLLLLQERVYQLE